MRPKALLHQGGEGKGCLRHGFDMLEHLKATHFRRFSLGAEKKKPKFTDPDFIIEKAEADKAQTEAIAMDAS